MGSFGGKKVLNDAVLLLSADNDMALLKATFCSWCYYLPVESVNTLLVDVLDENPRENLERAISLSCLDCIEKTSSFSTVELLWYLAVMHDHSHMLREKMTLGSHCDGMCL